MHNFLFVSLLLTITFTSCTSSLASPTTVINSASPTAKILPTFTPKASATPSLITSETPSATAAPEPFKTLISPNEEFIASAFFETEHPSGVQTIEIRNKGGKLLWQIPFQGELPEGYPRPFLNILQWSNDSSELYFYYVWSPDGGDFAFWWDGYNLQKIDIETGNISMILPGMGAFTFSPDGTQLAYTRSKDKTSIFYIQDLLTDSVKTAYVIFGSKGYKRVGNIRWSPTGKELAFQTETEDYMVQVILLNPATMKQRVIKEYELFTWLFDGWAENGKLQFSEISADGWRIDNVFQVDVTTFETLEIGTPTPGP